MGYYVVVASKVDPDNGSVRRGFTELIGIGLIYDEALELREKAYGGKYPKPYWTVRIFDVIQAERETSYDEIDELVNTEAMSY